MTAATNLLQGLGTMTVYNKLFMVGFSIISGLAVCAGCATEANKAEDTASTNRLRFSWVQKDDRNVQLGVSLESCRDGRVGCYSVADLDTDSEDHTGRSTAGDLTEQQLDALKALVTPDQLEHYEEDKDPECDVEVEVTYSLMYDEADGHSHFYCFLPGDHLSAETENAIEVMTEMAETLLVEGTPQTDKN